MTDEELDLVESQALVDALKRRVAVMVIAIIEQPRTDKVIFERAVDWSGGTVQSYGLATYLRDRLRKAIDAEEEPETAQEGEGV